MDSIISKSVRVLEQLGPRGIDTGAKPAARQAVHQQREDADEGRRDMLRKVVAAIDAGRWDAAFDPQVVQPDPLQS